MSADNGKTRDAVAAFHRLVDQGDYGAIYDAASVTFKASGSRDQAIGFFSRVNRKMGACQDLSLSIVGYQINGGGTFITAHSARKCANGTLGEQFVWQLINRGPVLIRYTVDNPRLLAD
jgi:hypothetical protein